MSKAAKLRYTPETANGTGAAPNGSAYNYTYEVGDNYDVIDPESGNGRQPRPTTVPSMIDRFLDYLFMIPDALMSLVLGILTRFTAPGGQGVRVVAGFLAIVGILLSADPFWQLFEQPPIFPWFEPDHLGWLRTAFAMLRGWMLLVFCVVLSSGVQWIESWGLRGDDPDVAKLRFQQYRHHKLPKLDPNSIDYTKHLHTKYKHAKMKDVRFRQVLVLAVLAIDIASFFISRNPFGMPPAAALGCLIYNLLAMMAGEVGIRLWLTAKNSESTV